MWRTGHMARATLARGTADLSFTGPSQDSVAGFYDFLYRKYNPVQGRWVSPDPAGVGPVSLSNPQSWNRYGYATNNPLALVDDLGLCSHHECMETDGNCSFFGLGGAWIPGDYPGGYAGLEWNCVVNGCMGDPGEGGYQPWGPLLGAVGNGSQILTGADSLNYPLGDLPAQLTEAIVAAITGNWAGVLGAGTGWLSQDLWGRATNCTAICWDGPAANNGQQNAGVPPNPQAVQQSMLQMLWKPALGALCSSLNSWSAEDAKHAKQDALIGGLTVAVAPPVSVVMLGTAGVYGTSSAVEEQAYNAICQ